MERGVQGYSAMEKGVNASAYVFTCLPARWRRVEVISQIIEVFIEKSK